MKLALTFLLVFVTASYQQQQYLKRPQLPWRPSGPAARAYYNNFYNPSFYNNDEDVALPRQRYQQPEFYAVEPSSSDGYEDYEDDDQQENIISPSSLMYEDIEIDSPSFRQNLPMSYYNQRSSINPRFWYLDDYAIQSRKNKYYPFYYQQNQPEEETLPHWADQIESRRKIGWPKKPAKQSSSMSNSAVAQQRFFGMFGGGGFGHNNIIVSTNHNNNGFMFPFGKTRGLVITSSVNLTTVQSCVDRSEFVVGNPTACRRRRRGIERLLSFDDEQDGPILPSNIQKLETTAMSPYQVYEERNARFHDFVASSKDDLVLDDDDGIDREKRSFFFYATTVTLTSYTFYNTTVTKTVRLLTAGTTSGLTCLPCNFIVC